MTEGNVSRRVNTSDARVVAPSRRKPLASALQPQKRKMYELIIKQLLHDGFLSAAEEVAQSAQIVIPSSHRDGAQLSRLVVSGLQRELLRAREIVDFAAKQRVERYLDAAEVYVPLPALRAPRVGYAERFRSNALGGVIRCVKLSTAGDLVVFGGSGGVGAGIFTRSACENETVAAASVGADSSAATLTATALGYARSFSDIINEGVESVSFHPTGEPLLCLGGSEGTLLVVDYGSPLTSVIARHEDVTPIRGAAWHPSGSHILFCVDSETPRLLDVGNGRVLTPCSSAAGEPGHSAAVADATFSPIGDLFATVGFDGSLMTWDCTTARHVAIFPNVHSRVPVTSCSFSRSGNIILTAGMDGLARLWDTRIAPAEAEVAAFGEPKRGKKRIKARFNAAESAVWLQDVDGSIALFDVYSASAVTTISRTTLFSHQCFAAGKFDDVLVTGGDDGRLRMWSPSALTI